MAVSYLTYQPMAPCCDEVIFSENLVDGKLSGFPSQVDKMKTSTRDIKRITTGSVELTFSVIYPPPSFPNLDDDDDDDDDELVAAKVLGKCYKITLIS